MVLIYGSFTPACHVIKKQGRLVKKNTINPVKVSCIKNFETGLKLKINKRLHTFAAELDYQLQNNYKSKHF